jgi:hypothetical protein
MRKRSVIFLDEMLEYGFGCRQKVKTNFKTQNSIISLLYRF